MDFKSRLYIYTILDISICLELFKKNIIFRAGAPGSGDCKRVADPVCKELILKIIVKYADLS